MKIFIILSLCFLGGCLFSNFNNQKIGDLFLYKDTLRDRNPLPIGQLYLKDSKLIFVKTKDEIFNESARRKIEMVKFEFSKINDNGYLKMEVTNYKDLGDEEMVSKSHYYRNIPINHKDFWNSLSLKMFYGYNVEIRTAE